jgi:transposase
MKYYNLIREMSRYNLRFYLVRKALKTSITEAARSYGTTRKTVRKWVRRYERDGLRGLKDRSRAPHCIPHKMGEEDEDRIVELRKRHRSWGARRLKERYGLTGSYTAIHRVIRQHGLVRKKRRRWRKRKDLSRLKQQMGLFERSQVDTKDLSDIYQYWPYMRSLGLPRYQYTLRELSTGAAFYAYANNNTSTNASLFARYVVAHLREYGIDPTQMRWQTDNGSEYIGKSMKRINRQSAFEKVLSEQGITHGRIPPRASYLQGDVETFHRICEDELYDIENYDNGVQFYGKAYAYQLYFNHVRKNRYRGNKSPFDILKERFSEAQEGIFNLPPINLEMLFDLYYNTQGGYHVPKPAPVKLVSY